MGSVTLNWFSELSLIFLFSGTGKSYIGALIAKAIHIFTQQTILVVCYTNHALDDILTSLLDIGIPEASMVRLGSKSTARTEPLRLRRNQGDSTSRNWPAIKELKGQLEDLRRSVESAFELYSLPKYSLMDILDYLEIEAPQYFKAFRVPESKDGMETTGANSKPIGPDYLLEKWVKGDRPKAEIMKSNPKIWKMAHDDRKHLVRQWSDALQEESIEQLSKYIDEFNGCQQRLQRELNRSEVGGVLRNKRIVGCTTTAAAMYREEIQTFKPDILLAEEAGEILESHVLTSLGPETSQMILIGDHR